MIKPTLHPGQAVDAAVPGAAVSAGRAEAWPARFSWIALALVALLYAGTCFAPVVFDDNEGLYAGAVREMQARGDWLVPTNNGFPRVQKPPLVYWAMLVSRTLLGGSEFALRLPNALATAGWIAATYLLVRRVGGERAGLGAALALATMLGTWVFTHLVQPEPFLAAFISLAFWCLVEARAAGPAPPRRWYLLFWTFLALGTLSKGLHGALWPLAVTGTAALLLPGWRPWLRPVLSLRGLGLFLLLVLPWYVYMTLHFRGFLAAHFVNEQIGASLNTRYPADARQLPLAQFYLQHLLFWLPWLLGLPAAVLAARAGWKGLEPARRDGVGLLACWLGVVLATVAFSTRQDYYSMSSWGAVAAFLALPWAVFRPGSPRAGLVVPGVLVLLAGIGMLGFAALLFGHFHAAARTGAAPIAQRDTFLSALEGISPALWMRLLPLMAVLGLAWIASGGAVALLAARGRAFAAFLALAAGAAVPAVLATAGFSVMSPYFSLAENARFLNGELAAHPGAVVACEALPNTGSSLFYYLDARVRWVNAPFDNQYAQQVLGEGRDFYWDEAALERAWADRTRPLYLILEEERLPYWRERLPGLRVLRQSGTRMVVAPAASGS